MIGPGDEDTLVELRKRITSPINTLATPGSTSLAMLQEIGITRVSFGPFIFRSCLKKFADIADALIEGEDYASWADSIMPSGESKEYLIRGRE